MSTYKKYEVKVVRHWYDRELHRPRSPELPGSVHRMARSEKEACAHVLRDYKSRAGGANNTWYSCVAEEVEG